jgi:hypothetical protein
MSKRTGIIRLNNFCLDFLHGKCDGEQGVVPCFRIHMNDINNMRYLLNNSKYKTTQCSHCTAMGMCCPNIGICKDYHMSEYKLFTDWTPEDQVRINDMENWFEMQRKYFMKNTIEIKNNTVTVVKPPSATEMLVAVDTIATLKTEINDLRRQLSASEKVAN